MDSEVALQDLCPRVIQQLRQIRADLVHLTEKYLETHGFHNLPHFDIHGGSASMGSDSWMEMAMEERLLANITAYIKLERRLMQVIEEQTESLLDGEGDLHGGLQNLMEQVSALRAQLEYLGTTIGLKMESEEGTDEVDGESGMMNVTVQMSTTQGLSPNVTSRRCVFPFKYEGRSFASCIPNGRDDGTYWCSETQDYDQDYKYDLCAASDGNPVTAKCHFPFIFLSKSFNSCTTEGRNDGQLWCSPTPNYDKDHQWIICKGQVASSPGNSRLGLILLLCLGVVILCVCIAGCCMKVQWRGIQSGLWWSSRRQVVLENEKDLEDANRPESIYENIDYKDAKDTTPI